MIHTYYLGLILLISLTACTNAPREEIQDNFQKYYDQYGVSGSLVLYDRNADHYTFYNKPQFDQPFTPASTFKICNTLIGLETGVIPDEHYTMAWDSVSRNIYWDKDHDLASAFQYSVVWYYQELARRVGEEQMHEWLEKAGYGNGDTSGGIDLFWLTGGLRISPQQQIDFLRRIYDNDLPFSERSLKILKQIMVEREQPEHVLRGKTGWGSQGEQEIGWFVGYVETTDNVYFFANCVQMPSEALVSEPERADAFNNSRRAIVDSVLVDLQIIQATPD